MSEFKGTKGPWQIRKLFGNAILSKDTKAGSEWYHNEINIHAESKRIVCSVGYATDTPNQGYGCSNNTTEWEANAKLIAAAPDLLEALKAVAEHAKEFGLSYDVYDQAESAIKKATEL